jgi:Uncharacterized protein conserved in bacteria
MTASAPAFKEWQIIVNALGAGEQILILRKGGIAEGRGGFQINASRFWLFPTQFHAQQEKTKPAAARWFTDASNDVSTISLRYFADVAKSVFLDRWGDVARLDPHHHWTEATVRERFEWSRPAGIHALVVRVYALLTPITLARTSEMGGCKSWIELPVTFDAQPSQPVLTEDVFTQRLATLAL